MQGMEQRMTLGLNCKVGDLAIVVSAVHAENIGQIVEVLGPQCKKPFDLAGQEHTWQVRTVSGRETLCYRRNTKGFVRIERFVEGPVPDCRLRPVTGLEDGDTAQEDADAGRTKRVDRRTARTLPKETVKQ
jgi:hypothetical protein